MPVNKRVYYPIQAVAFALHGTDFYSQLIGYIATHGLQSVGQNVSFNVEQAFELGQIEIYESIEGIPNVELTLEKVIDGYPLIQHLASQSPGGNSTLNGRYNDARINVIAATYPQTYNAASGVPLSIAFMSGMYLSSIGFNIPVQGNATESVTLVGNNRTWATGTAIPTGILYGVATRFNNADSPPGTGGIQRRENISMLYSRWPLDLPGISSSGTNNYIGSEYQSHIQNVTVNVSLGRTELFELGRRGPYYRYAEFPTEVTCTVEVTADENGSYVNAYEEQDNLDDQEIKIIMECGVSIDLGTKNKLTGTTESGGDASGGNRTVTYNYSNFNSLTVTFPNRDYL